MAEVNPAAWTQGGCHTAQVDRQVIAGLVCAQGVDEPGDLAVSAPGGMQTQVAAGGAFVEGTTTSGQGMYHVYNDAPVNLTHSPADATDPRIDLVIARVYDSQYAGTADEWVLEIVEGSPSPAPAPPTVPDSSLVLAQVTVRAGATEILSSDISDQAGSFSACGQGEWVDLTTLGAVASDGWSIDYAYGFRDGSGWVSHAFRATRTGSTLGPTNNGDITNERVFEGVPDVYTPGDDVGWSATVAGSGACFGLARQGGVFLLVALMSSNTIGSGEYITASVTFPNWS